MPLHDLLQQAVHRHASDLHLCPGHAPLLRIDGDLMALPSEPLNQKDIMTIINSIMNDTQRAVFEENWELDFSFEFADISRFRVNVFKQIHGIGVVFRVIPKHVPTFETLGLPEIFKKIASYPHGLVLVTGTSGSGKSTTLAAMVDYINQGRPHHILTIEDPIEYVHESKKCLVTQREVHGTTHSFKAALRSALREDPDIILVGELRDLETMRLALTAAETGHLVLATLHTSSAIKTINRMIDVFPGEEKSLVRSMLSESLQAVISQVLVKKITSGRALALEIMLCNPAIRNLIRENKPSQMRSVMQTSSSLGMHTLEQHLDTLVSQGIVNAQVARGLLQD